MMAQEHAYSWPWKDCFLILFPNLWYFLGYTYRAKHIRVLFSEITRILNILWLPPLMHGFRCSYPFSLGFEEREKLMEFYDVYPVLVCMPLISVQEA